MPTLREPLTAVIDVSTEVTTVRAMTDTSCCVDRLEDRRYSPW